MRKKRKNIIKEPKIKRKLRSTRRGPFFSNNNRYESILRVDDSLEVWDWVKDIGFIDNQELRDIVVRAAKAAIKILSEYKGTYENKI